MRWKKQKKNEVENLEKNEAEKLVKDQVEKLVKNEVEKPEKNEAEKLEKTCNYHWAFSFLGLEEVRTEGYARYIQNKY